MIYRFGECELDTSLYTLQRGGQTMRLRPKVFRVCLYLLEHRDRVITREELCAQVWPGQFISQATLEGVIRLVRQAVGDNGRAQGIIQTLHGCGYRFVAAVEEHPTKGIGGPSPLAVTFPRSQGPGILPHAAGIAIGVAAAHEPGSVSALVEASEPNQEAARANGYGVDSRATMVPGDRPPAPRRAFGGRRMVGAGLAVALVTLALLGGWGLWRSVRTQAPGPLERARIAVLPFIDLSAETDRAYFADGLTEELITQLARIRGLTVIARTSVMQYKGTRKDVATIGRELRVGTVLEGSVRRIDNQVRISAQLIDVASQGHLWSQEYDRELTGVFAIQSDIATRVAQWLKVQLTAEPLSDGLRGDPRFAALLQKLRLGE